MIAKLTDITTSYSSFEDDQVLTAPQLNKFLSYFDDQDRMSRICLSGVGIVCGFKPNYIDGTLVLSQGCGITTDGDLLHLLHQNDNGTESMADGSVTYTTYVPFVDDKAVYTPFFYNPVGGAQIDLWELQPENTPNPGPLLSTMPDLSDKVVLLYLESYNEDADLCVGINCDNLGIHEVQKLRVLLVSQDDAEYILSRDPMYNAADVFATYMDLDDVVVPRVLLNQTNAATFSALRDSYKNAITADSVVDNMKSSFTAMLGKLGKSTTAGVINTKLNTLFGISGVQNQPVLYFQYRYDALKDIVDTYMEMKELFLYSNTDCCPDITSFPKHLMLGKLIPTPDDTLYKRFRHSFYESPLLGDGQEDYERFNALLDRLLNQLDMYISTNIPRGEIKLTPSKFGPVHLGDKAIPFYYNVQNPLLNNWNFDKTKRNKQRRNLSYHTALLDQAPAIQKPLKYNLEPYNFVRIEGVQGYLYQEAMEKVNTIKYNNGLSFDLKALGITVSATDTIKIEDYACEFADLTTMLNALRAEHECILGNAAYYLSSYSVTRPSLNDREVEFFYPVKPSRPLTTLTPVKPNVVLANLNTKQGVTGRIFSEAFKTYDGCSANDIISKINVSLSQHSFAAWDKTVYDTTINKPAEILSNALLLLNYLPTRLPDLTRDRIAQYAINARNICGLVRRVQGVNTGELNPNPPLPTMPVLKAISIGDFGKDYNPDYYTGVPLKPVEPAMINTLMTQMNKVCCSTAQLESIMDEIEARKQKILLSLTLAKFVETHPGLEHFAGTKQGGTFLMVYLANSVNGIPANTVVADFALPYQCCSDCNSVNFIMPRPSASLSISQDRFCIGNDTSPLVFTPYPLNGVIKATKVVPGVTVNGTQLLIDPSLVPSSALGTPIYFTVNGQDTGTSVTIYRSPVVNFNVPESPTTQTQITFTPIGVFDTGTTFLWNFGDGEVSTNKVSVHQYAYPVNEDNKVTVSLTVTPPNGACPTTVKKDITFLDYQVNLDPKVFCNNDTTIYPFDIVPDDADVVITGNGVVPYDDAYKGFQPSAATPGEVTIYVNGSPWMELTVNPNPQSHIVGTMDSENLTLTSNMSDVEFYYWSFTDSEGNKIHDDITGNANPVIPLSEFTVSTGEIFVKLFIQNDCSTHTEQIAVELPVDFAVCSLEATDTINEADEALETLMDSGAYDDLTSTQKGLCEEAKALFDGVIADMSYTLEGNANEAISTTLSDLLFRIHGAIVVVNGDGSLDPVVKGHQLDILLKVYALCAYQLYPSILRCQIEGKIDISQVHDLFTLMVSHLLSSNSESFGQLGINIDPEGVYAAIIAEVLTDRTTGYYSWNALNQIMSLID